MSARRFLPRLLAYTAATRGVGRRRSSAAAPLERTRILDAPTPPLSVPKSPPNGAATHRPVRHQLFRRPPPPLTSGRQIGRRVRTISAVPRATSASLRVPGDCVNFTSHKPPARRRCIANCVFTFCASGAPSPPRAPASAKSGITLRAIEGPVGITYPIPAILPGIRAALTICNCAWAF